MGTVFIKAKTRVVSLNLKDVYDVLSKPIALYLALTPRSAGAAAIDDQIIGPLCTLRDWIYTIALIVGVIYVIIAAVKYMGAGGGEQVSEAHKALLYAVIGIAVALVAQGVPGIVQSIIGGEGPEDPCP